MLTWDEKEQLKAQLIPPFTDTQKKTIGRNIKDARERTVYTQADMAEIMNVSERTISRMETGETMCSLQTMLNFCKLYRCKMRDILPQEFAPYVSAFDAVLSMMDNASLRMMETAVGKYRSDNIA